MNPISLARRIEDDYRRYLETSFYIRDKDLRESFSESLAAGELVKGPYLEGKPAFVKGVSPRRLLADLGHEWDEGLVKALGGERPLYGHQENAIRRVSTGRNVIVATGTGSGKTESFLIPILLHLFNEYRSGTLCDGVRALILYPMNALANDQRERLGQIALALEHSQSDFRFTYGQYTGETPQNPSDRRRQLSGTRMPGELVYRDEMRVAPPHILLTNFSMLEYLLIRPNDSPLFDQENALNWRFLVLDEAHQYKGTKGIEIGMLLRRLKQRLRAAGNSLTIQCIGTSATLFNHDSDRPQVAEFACKLFDEEFAAEDVISGQTHPIHDTGKGELDTQDYETLLAVAERTAQPNASLTALASKVGASIDDTHPVSFIISEILAHDTRSVRLRQIVQSKPTTVAELCEILFPDLSRDDATTVIAKLARLLSLAVDRESQGSLLAPRYHFFVRSMEGAFLSYEPNPKVRLTRLPQNDEKLFELALCHECGQHYLVGRITEGRLVEAKRDPSSEDFEVLFFRPLTDDEDAPPTPEMPVYLLCKRCGAVSQPGSDPQCGHDDLVVIQRQKRGGQEDRVSSCSACGFKSFDPVRELVYGSHGPTSVIASTLASTMQAEGKHPKVLAFSDGRQEAAYFAYYLEDSIKSLQDRSLILAAGQRLSTVVDGASLEELAVRIKELLLELSMVSENLGHHALTNRCWETVFREFVTEQSRISLEGVGLIGWELKWPTWLPISDELRKSPWNLNEFEAKSLVVHLLSSLKSNGAVNLPETPNITFGWEALERNGPQRVCRIGPPHGNAAVVSWDSAATARGDFLRRVLENQGTSEVATESIEVILRIVWQTIMDAQEGRASSDYLLSHVNDGRRLNPQWWRLKCVTDDHDVYECNVCSRLATINIHATCPRFRCPGTLVRADRAKLAKNHYRSRYLEPLKGPLRVEEHTAQLSRQCATEYQREFRDGHINILSSSTTFELGVDLGDLEVVLQRNVPPESFNYAQRVGRSGRRSGMAGLAVTYCGRSPHDQYHFHRPELMIEGAISAPTLDFCNQKIAQRHLVASALSSFFRALPSRFENVITFLGDTSKPQIVEDFSNYIRGEAQLELSSEFKNILPKSLHAPLGLTDANWHDWMADESSRLSIAAEEVSADIGNLVAIKQQAFAANQRGLLNWAMKRVDTLEKEDVLSFLSRKVVIPKYGFPVEIVELEILADSAVNDIAMQRDLSIALSEFAPTNRIIANKKEWSAYALKRVPEKEWERNWYGRCPVHGTFLSEDWDPSGRPPDFRACCPNFMTGLNYIVPQFGFSTAKQTDSSPGGRPQKLFSTRPYFAGLAALPSTPVEYQSVVLHPASPGHMAVVCEGRRGSGFFICSRCGAGFVKRPNGGHRDAFDRQCAGTMFRTSLGHKFLTDVVRLDFKLPPDGVTNVWFTQSLASAISLGAASALQVPTTDVNAVALHTPDPPHHRVVLYDDVPGGAGLVERLRESDVLDHVLRCAYERVAVCNDCSPESSCYTCLRNYRNQFAHEHLQRGPVADLLARIIA